MQLISPSVHGAGAGRKGWFGPDMTRDPSWIYLLSAAEIAEIDARLRGGLVQVHELLSLHPAGAHNPNHPTRSPGLTLLRSGPSTTNPSAWLSSTSLPELALGSRSTSGAPLAL